MLSYKSHRPPVPYQNLSFTFNLFTPMMHSSLLRPLLVVFLCCGMLFPFTACDDVDIYRPVRVSELPAAISEYVSDN
ncbi:MAG: hypothetical protein OHK0039_07050 [Bacteroidia bacterium]